MPAEAVYVQDSHGFTALARSLKVATPTNACANILVTRIVELAGLRYEPAALTTVAQISAHIEALNDPEQAVAAGASVPLHKPGVLDVSPSKSSSGGNDKYLQPDDGDVQHTLGSRQESQRASAFPSNLSSQGEWSPLTQARHDKKIETNSLLQRFVDHGDAEGGQGNIKAAYERLMACLPFVELHESLLYSEAEQDLLAPHLTSSVIEAACNGQNYDMVLQLVTLMPRLKDCVISDADHRIKFDQTASTSQPRLTNLLCWAVRHRNLEIVARLMQLGVDVNTPEPGGQERLENMRRLYNDWDFWCSHAVEVHAGHRVS